MGIVASVIDIRGKAYEPVIEEILFGNNTVADNLVSFEVDVKAETIFTENINTAVMQAYTYGRPISQGSLGVIDTLITPAKVMYYMEYATESLRTSRFKRTMKDGAWNTASTEFEKTVLMSYGNLISHDAEKKFWMGLTPATQAAIAALTAGTANNQVSAAEQNWAAAQITSTSVTNSDGVTQILTQPIDGIIGKMIYNSGALGGRVKQLGTTITAANIAVEYAKIYTDIPAVVINASAEQPYIYAPYSHKQLINIFNVSAIYRNIFSVSDNNKTYYYNGIEIKFVPIPENCMIVSLPSNLIWCTDLLSDLNYMEGNKIALNRDDQFIKNVFTLAAHVVNQKYNVLYLG